MSDDALPAPDIHFERITARTVLAVCHLTYTLTPLQRDAVEDNAESIAQAHFSDSAWFRAIYADEEPVGFIMVHVGSDYADGVLCPGVFLWRFMIAGPHQGKGYGQRAIAKLCDHLRALGVPRLYTSCVVGPASPEAFYRRLGFVRTGEWYGDEPALVLELDRS